MNACANADAFIAFSDLKGNAPASSRHHDPVAQNTEIACKQDAFVKLKLMVLKHALRRN